jgi:protein-tyrosine-phosphatase
LLEVNGRFWGSLPLATACGADFPLALYQMQVENDPDVQQRYRTHIYSRSLTRDLAWHKEALRDQSATAQAKILHLAQEGLGTAIRSISGCERIDSWAIGDPGPLVAEVQGLFKSYAASRRVKRTRQALLSSDARRKLHNQACQSLQAASSVLFVCKGNICRSPFAEQLAKRHWPQTITVSSAGYFPEAGRIPPEWAQRAATLWNVDLGQHRSRVLTADMVRSAEVILVFDQSNYDRLVKEYSFARDRLHFLGAIDISSSLTIEDPYGKSLEVYRAVYTQIAHAVTAAGSLVGMTSGTSPTSSPECVKEESR